MTENAFLQTLRDRPDDDVTRRVYADARVSRKQGDLAQPLMLMGVLRAPEEDDDDDC